MRVVVYARGFSVWLFRNSPYNEKSCSLSSSSVCSFEAVSQLWSYLRHMLGAKSNGENLQKFEGNDQKNSGLCGDHCVFFLCSVALFGARAMSSGEHHPVRGGYLLRGVSGVENTRLRCYVSASHFCNVNPEMGNKM